MSTLLTVKQVKSLTIGFALPETYDMNRVEEIKIYLGKNVYPHTIDGRVVKCQIKSDDTAVMHRVNRLSFWLDDSIIGVYPIYCGDIVFEYTNAIGHNESINKGFDLMVNLTISETAITVDNVLYNYVKGDKLTFSDLTPSDIAELQQPANNAIASIQAVEVSVEQAEAIRVQAEIDRQANTGTAIQNAQTATTNANTATTNAQTATTSANNAATLANTKAGLADTAATNANNVANGYAATLAGKEATANKQNSLATDGTGVKYPTVDAVNMGLALKANKVQEAWLEPTLVNSWANDGENKAMFMKDDFGFIHCKGNVRGGAVGSIIFTFPAGYITLYAKYFVCNSDGYRASYIWTNYLGEVKLSAGGTTGLSLDQIYFKADS